MKRTILSLFLLILLGFGSSSFAQLYDWRGPQRTGVYNETGLLKQWPQSGPVQIMEIQDLGMGFSSPTITDDAIYITGRKDTLENRLWAFLVS